MKNILKVIVLALLIPGILFAQEAPTAQEEQSEEVVEEVSLDHHLIYYDDPFLAPKEYYLDGKRVDDLSEIKELLLANERSRHYAKVSSFVMGFAYFFGGTSGALLALGINPDAPYSKQFLISSAISFGLAIISGCVSGHYFDKAIDEYQ